MKTYEVTELGKKLARNGGGDPADRKIIDYVWGHPMSTAEELEFVGETWRLHNLVRRGFLKTI